MDLRIVTRFANKGGRMAESLEGLHHPVVPKSNDASGSLILTSDFEIYKLLASLLKFE